MRLDLSPLTNIINNGLERLNHVTCESVAALATVIGDHATLMVLDKEATSQAQSDNVMRLLRECENLRVITTTGPLGIRGEQTLALPPLETPTRPHTHNPLSLSQFAAVQLLTSYARQVRADFRLTAENAQAICLLTQYVDGIPAALEALASWLLIYEPEVLKYRADRDLFSLLESPPDPESTFAIQKSLHEAIEALESPERALLEMLIDKASSWSVNEVATSTAQDTILCARLVRVLLAKGLIRSVGGWGPPHFQVLNLVRRWYRWPDDLPISEYWLAGVTTLGDPIS
jgi:predicted ATPase